MFPLFPFLAYTFSMTFTPGPNNIMSMANANQFGYKKTLNFLLGVACGFFAILLLSGIFNISLTRVMPTLHQFLRIFGVLYIGYLGIALIIPHRKNQAPRKHLNNFFVGFGMQFVNPKGILFAITIMADFIIPYYTSAVIVALFSLLLTAIVFLAISSWAILGLFFQKFLSQYGTVINTVLGLILIYSAISISGIIK